MRLIPSPTVISTLLSLWLAAPAASADIITYRFTGDVLEIPTELIPLLPADNMLVFTLKANSGIPAEESYNEPLY